MYFKAYLQTQTSSLLDIMGKSKEISQDFRKKIVDLHKSDSSLGAISKCLKVPSSSVQTIVRKYKHYETTQTAYRSGRRRVLSPRDANQSQNNSKGPCEDAGGNRYRSIYIHIKSSHISTQPERPLRKEEATAPKPPLKSQTVWP